MIVNAGVNLCPTTGGTYRTVLAFNRAWNDYGYSSRVLTFDSVTHEHPITDGIHRVSVDPGPLSKAYHFWSGCYDGRLNGLLQGCSLLCIHGLFVHPLWHAALWAARNRVPFVVIPHGSLDPYTLSYRRWRKLAWLAMVRERLLNQASAVIFATVAEAAKAAPYTTDSPNRVIPWPVQVDSHEDKARDRAALRRRFGWSPDQRVAVFCGRIHPMKRPVETIDSFLRVPESANWKLLLIGAPSAEIPERTISRLCESSGGRCLFAGFVDHDTVMSFNRGADLSVLLSHRENFGYSTAEAMAVACPVLVSRGVDLSGDIAAADCGFVAPDLGDGITQAMTAALSASDSSLRAKGEHGRQWISANCEPRRFSELVGSLVKHV